MVEMVREDHYPELYPDAVAQCIFEAAPSPPVNHPAHGKNSGPTCNAASRISLSPSKSSPWRPTGEPRHEQPETDDPQRFADLESRLLGSDRGNEGALMEEARSNWQRLAEERERAVEEQRKLVEELRRSQALLQEERGNWQQLAEEREKIVDEIKQSKALLEEEKNKWQRLAEEREQIIGEQRAALGQMEEAGAAMQEKNRLLEKAQIELEDRFERLSTERDELQRSYERQIGDLVVNRLRLRGPLEVSE